MRKKCLWSVFSRIWTEYGEIRNISPFSVRMRENTHQNNSKYGHFSRSVIMLISDVYLSASQIPVIELLAKICNA